MVLKLVANSESEVSDAIVSRAKVSYSDEVYIYQAADESGESQRSILRGGQE